MKSPSREMKRLRIDELPEAADERVAALVAQSAPNPDRPIVTEEIDRALHPVERQAAACYAAIEDAAVRMTVLARQIDDGKVE